MAYAEKKNDNVAGRVIPIKKTDSLQKDIEMFTGLDARIRENARWWRDLKNNDAADLKNLILNTEQPVVGVDSAKLLIDLIKKDTTIPEVKKDDLRRFMGEIVEGTKEPKNPETRQALATWFAANLHQMLSDSESNDIVRVLGDIMLRNTDEKLCNGIMESFEWGSKGGIENGYHGIAINEFLQEAVDGKYQISAEKTEWLRGKIFDEMYQMFVGQLTNTGNPETAEWFIQRLAGVGAWGWSRVYEIAEGLEDEMAPHSVAISKVARERAVSRLRAATSEDLKIMMKCKEPERFNESTGPIGVALWTNDPELGKEAVKWIKKNFRFHFKETLEGIKSRAELQEVRDEAEKASKQHKKKK